MAKSIDAGTLKRWLHDGAEIALLDVREYGQYGEGHPFFATHVPYSRLEMDVGRLIPRTGTRIVLYDDGDGSATAPALARLAATGYVNLHVLAGGAPAWAAAGYQLFKGVNLPSKTFGELVEHVYDTPRVSVTELDAMLKRGDDVVVLDGRPLAEYHNMSIPTGICCPNGELVYRVGEIVKNPATRIVVNCAGRTRSILGAQTLRNFGIANPVFALENGTQGWTLADLELERGADRRYPEIGSGTDRKALRDRARALAERHGVKYVGAAEVEGWIGDAGRNVFLCDVRTPEEFVAGSIPGAQHAPGGQLVQATDQYVGVRNARIVLFDSELVRAPTCASWLAQMGHDVSVLLEGAAARLAVPPGPLGALPSPASITASGLAALGARAVLLDLRSSSAYRKEHVEGAHWAIRPRLQKAIADPGRTVVLMTREPAIARLAAIDLAALGIGDVRVLSEGLDACKAAGLKLAATPGMPPDAECIDFLFFVHDRHEGNRDAARRYLEWETGLLAQVDDAERGSFRLPAAH